MDKATIKKSATPFVTRTLRATMKLPLPAQTKRALWNVANRNFLYMGSTVVGTDLLDNRLLCRTDDLVQKHIAVFGLWEPNLTAWICEEKR